MQFAQTSEPARGRWLSVVAALFTLTLCAGVMRAQTLTVTTQDGSSTDVSYDRGTLKKRYVAMDSGRRLDYAQIDSIATDDFDVYEEAVKRTSRRSNRHVTVRYTGQGDVNVLRLQKLEKKRQGAGAARGAGGLMMLLGVLGGDRDVYAAGLMTYGAGTIAQDLNTEKMMRTQNRAIAELEAQQARQKELKKASSLEEQYRIEYGDENVDGLMALIDGDHERALAFAEVAETSDDANYRFSAVWLKAVIYADQGDREALEKEYDRLIVLDPEVSNREDAERWTRRLLEDLEELRHG